MSNEDHQAFRAKLDEFSRRLDARIREFKERGEFSSVHGPFADTIRSRQAAIREKLDSAISKAATWDMMKLEFERDFDAVVGDFAEWEKRLDDETMKRQGKRT